MLEKVGGIMSRRLLALTLAASLGAGTTLFAEGNLLESASRAVQAMEREQGIISAPNLWTTVAGEALAARLDPARREAQQGEGAGTLSKSKMSGKKKALIYVAIAAGFAVSLHEIDLHALDVTPSHLGTRQDGCNVVIFGC
jgi:hypothetical protein